MRVVERGSGSPVVLVPGIQGRWDWMTPTVEALAARHRVLTFSLGQGASIRDWVDVIDLALDRAQATAATLIGVSFGGLVALRYAAERHARVNALVLVSTPPPAWRLDRWSSWCVDHPWLGLPLFGVRGSLRLYPEIVRARPSWRTRLELGWAYTRRVMTAPISPADMAGYVRAWRAANLSADCDRVQAPALVVTGERGRDRVVPVEESLKYLDLIRGAAHAELPGTGHVGFITKPDAFAITVDRFLERVAGGPEIERTAAHISHAS